MGAALGALGTPPERARARVDRRGSPARLVGRCELAIVARALREGAPFQSPGLVIDVGATCRGTVPGTCRHCRQSAARRRHDDEDAAVITPRCAIATPNGLSLFGKK